MGDTATSPVRATPCGLFVTGTDTGVGKTLVTAALASLLTDLGWEVQPRKPVESGCPRVGDCLQPQDALCLREAAGSDIPLDRICRYPLALAVSPERAAAAVGLTPTLDELVDACHDGLGVGEFLLVEGAGGFYSPIAPGWLNADLAVALQLPVLLVAADRLGTIGQVLLASEAIARRGLALAGVVLNRTGSEGVAGMDNATDIGRWLGHAPIVTEFAGLCEVAERWRALRPALSPFAAAL